MRCHGSTTRPTWPESVTPDGVAALALASAGESADDVDQPLGVVRAGDLRMGCRVVEVGGYHDYQVASGHDLDAWSGEPEGEVGVGAAGLLNPPEIAVALRVEVAIFDGVERERLTGLGGGLTDPFGGDDLLAVPGRPVGRAARMRSCHGGGA